MTTKLLDSSGQPVASDSPTVDMELFKQFAASMEARYLPRPDQETVVRSIEAMQAAQVDGLDIENILEMEIWASLFSLFGAVDRLQRTMAEHHAELKAKDNVIPFPKTISQLKDFPDVPSPK